MYLLVVVLLFSGGQYDERVFRLRSQAECESAMTAATDTLKGESENGMVGYWMACSAVKGREI